MIEDVLKNLAEATDELRKEIEKLTFAISFGGGSLAAPRAKAKPKAKPKVEPKVEADDAETTPDRSGDEISLEDLHAMVMLKSRAGHQSTIREFLDGFNVRKLSDLTYDQRCGMRGLVEALKDKK
tara:strand:+ start:2805 stop:3179 length:375 start_codon:yes stop_codon:yes gene_type:complete